MDLNMGNKKGQASGDCLPHDTASEVELQGELDVARGLGAVDQPHVPRGYVGRGSVQIHTVEGVDEVGPELQSLGLGDAKVLLQAQVQIEIAGPSNRSLRRAGAELADGRWGERAGIEPLIADEGASAGVKRRFSAEGVVGAIAIRAQSARAGTRRIAAEVIQRQRETAMQRDDGVKGPSSCDRAKHLRRIGSKSLAASVG